MLTILPDPRNRLQASDDSPAQKIREMTMMRWRGPVSIKHAVTQRLYRFPYEVSGGILSQVYISLEAFHIFYSYQSLISFALTLISIVPSILIMRFSHFSIFALSGLALASPVVQKRDTQADVASLLTDLYATVQIYTGAISKRPLRFLSLRLTLPRCHPRSPLCLLWPPREDRRDS